MFWKRIQPLDCWYTMLRIIVVVSIISHVIGRAKSIKYIGMIARVLGENIYWKVNDFLTIAIIRNDPRSTKQE